MDLAEPGRGIAGGLTLPILRTLAGRSTPATAAQLRRVADVGTEAGVRRALERLAVHGVCTSQEIGGRIVYSLNDDHVLYPAVAALLHANRELPRRLTQALSSWEPAPMTAVLFGSAARHDGDTGSDVDLLLVRLPMTTDLQKRQWDSQVYELREAVHRWTGNRLQVLDWTKPVLRRHAKTGERLIDALLSEGVTVHGTPLPSVLGAAS